MWKIKKYEFGSACSKITSISDVMNGRMEKVA
jgi:hypothetical protein